MKLSNMKLFIVYAFALVIFSSTHAQLGDRLAHYSFLVGGLQPNPQPQPDPNARLYNHPYMQRQPQPTYVDRFQDMQRRYNLKQGYVNPIPIPAPINPSPVYQNSYPVPVQPNPARSFNPRIQAAQPQQAALPTWVPANPILNSRRNVQPQQTVFPSWGPSNAVPVQAQVRPQALPAFDPIIHPVNPSTNSARNAQQHPPVPPTWVLTNPDLNSRNNAQPSQAVPPSGSPSNPFPAHAQPEALPVFDPIIQPAPVAPERGYMRPVPQNAGLADRSRSVQESAFDQWMNDQLNGPSFWDRKSTANDKIGTNPQPQQSARAAPVVPAVESIQPPNSNMFNVDGSVNTNRPGMIKVAQEDDVNDKKGGDGFDQFNSFLSQFDSTFFSEDRGRSVSSGSEAVVSPKAPEAIVQTSDDSGEKEMSDRPYINIPKDFLLTNYTEGLEKDDSAEDDSTEDDSTEDDEESVDNDDNKKERSKRQAIHGDSFTSNGLSCDHPEQFPMCQYYPRCFSEVNARCTSRDSYLGDEVSSICTDLQNLATSIDSDVLREFLAGVISCVDAALVRVLEYPSCDDVTGQLAHSLLVEGKDNCVAKTASFCRLVETPVARYNLAKVFAQPKGRHDFMLRLLVSLGKHSSSLCQGPGVNIFLLDLMSNVMASNTTYTMPGGQPMPVFEP